MFDKSGTVTGLPPSTSVFPFTALPPILHTWLSFTYHQCYIILANDCLSLNKPLLSLSGSNKGTNTYHSIHSKCSLISPFLRLAFCSGTAKYDSRPTHCTRSVISVTLLQAAVIFPTSHLTAIDSCFSHCDYMLATFWSCKDSLQGISFFPILSSGFLHISITCMHTVLEIFHCITQQYSVVSDANRDISFCHFKPDRHISQMVLILPVSHTTLDMMLSCLCGKLQTVNMRTQQPSSSIELS